MTEQKVGDVPAEGEVVNLHEAPAPETPVTEAIVIADVIGPPGPGEWRAMREQAQSICKTDFVPAGFRNKPEAVLAAILTGRELRLGPMQSLQQIAIVDGKPAYSAELMRALVRRSGHKLQIVESDHVHAFVRGIRKDTGEVDEVTWTLDDAVRAGLVDKIDDNGRPVARSQNNKPLPWEHYPRALLLARATSELVRRLFSDVLVGGSYTPEELGGDWDEPAEPPGPAEVARRQQAEKMVAAIDKAIADNTIAATDAQKVAKAKGLATRDAVLAADPTTLREVATELGLDVDEKAPEAAPDGQETAQEAPGADAGPSVAQETEEPPLEGDGLPGRIRSKKDEPWVAGADDPGDAIEERRLLLEAAAVVIDAQGWDEPKVRQLLGHPGRKDVAKALGASTLSMLRIAVELLEKIETHGEKEAGDGS